MCLCLIPVLLPDPSMAGPAVNILVAEQQMLSSSSQNTQPSTPPPVDAVSGMEISPFPASGDGKRCRGADDTTEEDDGDWQSHLKRLRATDMHPDDFVCRVMCDELRLRYKNVPTEVTVIAGAKYVVEAALSVAHVEAHLHPCSGGTYTVYMTEPDKYPENKDERELHRHIASGYNVFESGMAFLSSDVTLPERTTGPLRIAIQQCYEPAHVVRLLEGVDAVEMDAPGTHLINQWVVGLAERLGVELQPDHFLGRDIFREQTELSSKKYVNYEALWASWPDLADKWLAGRALGLLPRQWSIPLGFNSTQFPTELSQWIDDENNPPSYATLAPASETDTASQAMARNRISWRLRYQRYLVHFLCLLSVEPVISGSNFSAFPGSSSGAGVPRGLPAHRPLAESIQRAGRGGQVYYLGQMIIKLALYASGYHMGTDWLLSILADTSDVLPKEALGAMFLAMRDWHDLGHDKEPSTSNRCDLPLVAALAAGKEPGYRNLCTDAEVRNAASQQMRIVLAERGMSFGTFFMAKVREQIAPHETYFTPEKFGLALAQLMVKGEVPCEHTDALRALQLAILRGEIPATAYPHLTAACTMKHGYLVEANGMNVVMEAGGICGGMGPPVMWPASSLPVSEWEPVLWEVVVCRLNR